MTRRDEVIGMAQEAGLIELRKKGWAPVFQGGADDIERFADLVAAAERERCAKESEAIRDDYAATGSNLQACAADYIAEKIRALKDGDE